MKRNLSFQRLSARVLACGIVAAVLITSGCSGEYGYTRSVFQGKVVDRSAEEIESFAGKPDSVDTLSGGDIVWTFNKRTFDSENANAKDAAVKITLKKDAKTGALKYSEIDFVAL